MVSKIGLNTGGSLYTSCRSYRRHFYLKTANHNRLFSIDEGLKKRTDHIQHHSSTTD